MTPPAADPVSDAAPHPAAGPTPTVLFVVFQTENRANGGVESITQVIENLQRRSDRDIDAVDAPTFLAAYDAELRVVEIEWESEPASLVPAAGPDQDDVAHDTTACTTTGEWFAGSITASGHAWRFSIFAYARCVGCSSSMTLNTWPCAGDLSVASKIASAQFST